MFLYVTTPHSFPCDLGVEQNVFYSGTIMFYFALCCINFNLVIIFILQKIEMQNQFYKMCHGKVPSFKVPFLGMISISIHFY